MNLSTLTTFLTVIETGNFNRAAERLNVTQSTVTARVNALEAEIGQVLILRLKSGAELTSAGFKFRRYAELMTQIWRQARQETALPETVQGSCNIGCQFDLWTGAGREWFDGLRHSDRRIAVSAWPGEQTDIDRWLSTGLVDVALCFAPKIQEGWSVRPLFEDRLRLVSTVRRKFVRWDENYIYVDMGDEFRRAHAAAYPDGDTPAVTFGSASWALDHMLRHGGSGYLPQRLVEAELESGVLHLVAGAPEFSRRAYIVWNTTAARQWPWFEPSLNSVFG